MISKIRTIDFLPEIFRTKDNKQFLSATLDQLVQPGNTTKIEGFIGSKFGYGVNASDKYVIEFNKSRNDYQLDPAVVFLKKDTDVARDLLTYPGFIDSVKIEGSNVENHEKLFSNQFYSWDSFVCLDKLINYSQYYWLPSGPSAVQVTTELASSDIDFTITDTNLGYRITGDSSEIEGINPTIFLLRGSTYSFRVNQENPLWIQGVPGVTGYDPIQVNVNTREILGVSNNGVSNGVIYFDVPFRDAQQAFKVPGTFTVDLVSSLPFEQINGKRISEVNGIDSVLALNGKSLMFYGTEPGVKAYVSKFFGYGEFGENDPVFNTPISANITEITTTTLTNTAFEVYGDSSIICQSTAGFVENEEITFSGTEFGGISSSATYYIKEILSDTSFTVSATPGGVKLTLTPDVGSMTLSTFTTGVLVCNSTVGFQPDESISFSGISFGDLSTDTEYFIKDIIDQTRFTISAVPGGSKLNLPISSGFMVASTNTGVYEDGANVVVNNTLFQVNLLGDEDPVIYLTVAGTLPTDQKITALFGKQWINRNFIRSPNGVITLVPYLAAELDTLYYQDSSNPDKVGKIRLVDDTFQTIIDVERDILGERYYTSPNGVVFTNGLKVIFFGDTFSPQYRNREFYVEGVGTGIKLIDVKSLVVLEKFSQGVYSPFDILSFDTQNYELTEEVPLTPDYITINRSSIDANPWSRSNRWFHYDVIAATARYNNDPTILGVLNSETARAKRPIIEFYPNLKLFDSGIQSKGIVDFIDFSVRNAFESSGPLRVAGFEVDSENNVFFFTSDQTNRGTATEDPTRLAAVPLFDGARVIFANEEDSVRRKTIYTVNIEKIKEVKVAVTKTEASDVITVSNTADLVVDAMLSLSGTPFGGLSPINYYIAEIIDETSIKLKDSSGTIIDISSGDADTGVMIGTLKINPIITLSETNEEPIQVGEQILVRYPNTPSMVSQYGKAFYFTGTEWETSQEKLTLNQPPLFDVIDINGVSLSDQTVYPSSSFLGTKLFSYGEGTGANDTVLGFPIKYSAVYNLGDISFDTNFNSDKFTYVQNRQVITKNVNEGYVQEFQTLNDYKKLLGWETAAGPSFQYQIFNIVPTSTTNSFVCDIPAKSVTQTPWAPVQVYVDNARLTPSQFTVLIEGNNTFITTSQLVSAGTPVQVLLLSEMVSKQAYFDIPLNLSNNPFNEDINSVSIGEIRGHYQTIFKNFPYISGSSLGSNNYRDQGKLINYGTKIVQHSASMVFSAMFLRNTSHNIFNALTYNANEYVKFKSLIVDTTTKVNFGNIYAPDEMLDSILELIASTKDSDSAFFWSDMVPLGTPYIINSYNFNNFTDTSQFNLSRVYNFGVANYNGVLVYLTRTQDGLTYRTLLVKDKDYVISDNSPSITVNVDLQIGDVITIKEYNQTYGSFVPNTPTKLGLYQSFEPTVYLDDTYLQPTYFLKGHDGSLTKLYGEYNDGLLQDIRDKVLFEFEKRIYNNLKVPVKPAMSSDDIKPGQFRSAIPLHDLNEMYSLGFLNWVGQNRLDFKTRFYDQDNPFTWNYTDSENRLLKTPIEQGGWRGVYLWLYDTDRPHVAPWEMLGFSNKPVWWDSRYGSAPYTSDNLVLWNDLANGIDWNNGSPRVIETRKRPDLLKIIPVDSQGKLISPFYTIVGNYNDVIFKNEWEVGDVGPTEASYIKSSTWPFDLMKLFVLTEPAKFFGLFIDTDKYRLNEEFNQFLLNNRRHYRVSDLEIYGSGIPKHSYINWIVDYEKQFGINAVEMLTDVKDNLDVRLAYRLAGFSDKDLLKFYVEKSTPTTKNTSLLIPDASYSVLLYDNQPFENIEYSSIIIQKTRTGHKIWGNSQNKAYFKTAVPKNNGIFEILTLGNRTVKVSKEYTDEIVAVPYGTEFFTIQAVAEFLKSYGVYLENAGMQFNQIESGNAISWNQMILEVLYWTQSGWEEGATINVNPSAKVITINKESSIVQPLTLKENIVLNQNLLPIELKDLCVYRDGTEFNVRALNEGDSLCFFKANLFNMEHVVVFNNTTIFNDRIYNLTTGLRQQRILVKGSKTADWDGSVNAYGFILNQDNIEEWKPNIGYTKGVIVKYKNNYWVATKVVQPSSSFSDTDWVKTDYNTVQKGLLPNPSLAAYESTIFYDINRTNLEYDTNLLGFSSIGYRPRQYLSDANLTDVSQVNVYKNMIKTKGTFNAANNFNGVTLQQGSIDYDIFENWAIKSGEYGGVLNASFFDVKLDQSKLISNPNIIGMIFNNSLTDVQQSVPLYDVYNFDRQLPNANVLPTTNYESSKLPYAGYVNFDDIKVNAYNLTSLTSNTESISTLYHNDYVWLADYKGTWRVYSPISLGAYDGTSCNNGVLVVECNNNLDGTVNLVFNAPHGLAIDDPFGLIYFSPEMDGYYTVLSTPAVNTVRVAKSLAFSMLNVRGAGLAFKFQPHRVSKGSEIASLPLTNTAFNSTDVWVDEDVSGAWAVYRKTLNYKEVLSLEKDSNTTFGEAVAYIPNLGFIVTEPKDGTVANVGKAFLYKIGQLESPEEIVNSETFGTTIAHSDDMVLISQPNGTLDTDRKIYVYQAITSNGLKELRLQQTIDAPNLSDTDWGTGLAISKDNQWIYVGSTANNKVYAYAKNQDWAFSSTGLVMTSATLVGQGFVTVTGNQTATILPGTRLSFSNSGNETYLVSGVSFDGTNSRISFTSTLTQPHAIGTIYFAKHNYYLVDDDFIVPATSIPTDKFGYRISTNDDGSKIFVSAPETNESSVLIETGTVHIFDRIVQTFEIQDSNETSVDLGWTPNTVTRVLKNFEPLRQVDDYSVNASVIEGLELSAGDIITVHTNKFVRIQTINSSEINDGRPHIRFGKGLDTSYAGDELLAGAPFRISSDGKEGVVYRFTNGGKKYGLIKATSDFQTIGSPVDILINGFRLTIQGDLATVVNSINTSGINNVNAYALENKLVITLINESLNPVHNKLNVSVFDASVLTSLGFTLYQKTQEITSVHKLGSSQFGDNIKFNQYGSFIVSAPADTRFTSTTFDFFDDSKDNDTYFDNDFTKFVDGTVNAGSVYMYDYLQNVNESIDDPGQFAFAQSIVDFREHNGIYPNFGRSLDFSYYNVMVGVPDYENVSETNGKAFHFENALNKANWSVFRSPSEIVDVNKLQDIQIFSSNTKETYGLIDYIDPLQGKLLGAVQQNIDFITSTDPAGYNRDGEILNGNLVWDKHYVGRIWFDTTNVRFVDYHQNDTVYNSKYWGTIFPGSDIAVYTWIESTVKPEAYAGPGVPKNTTDFVTRYETNAANILSPRYYFWVRNTGLVFENMGKTLSDVIIAFYILNPQNSGIAYFAGYSSDKFGLYNCAEFIKDDSILHVGVANGSSDDTSYQKFSLIREGNADDFLSGLPRRIQQEPTQLYAKFIDSLAGMDSNGQTVPDHRLPESLKYGVLVRPRQGFFVDRLQALKNYLTYANSVLSQFPITETRNPQLIFKTEFSEQGGEAYLVVDTPSYWELTNWWASGYSDTTKPTVEVARFSDLYTLEAYEGLIAAVARNGNGLRETHIFTQGNWVRIGLEKGTIQFKSSLWDYSSTNEGFGDGYFGSETFNQIPVEETKNIIRSLNEEIFVNDLIIHRNKSLILMFEYIKSENNLVNSYSNWLNKTSFVDVTQTVSELESSPKYQLADQTLLSGYINEVKPYHVVIKDFQLKYKKLEPYFGDISDFDLPAYYDENIDRFVSPQLTYGTSFGDSFNINEDIWQSGIYQSWFNNYGLRIEGVNDFQVSTLASYVSITATELFVDNGYSFPESGIIKVENELIGYTSINRITGKLQGVTRGAFESEPAVHLPGTPIITNLPGVVVLNSGRLYSFTPKVFASIDTTRYPAPRREAKFRVEMKGDRVSNIVVVDSGDGYAVQPTLTIEPSLTFNFVADDVDSSKNVITIENHSFINGDLVKFSTNEDPIPGSELINDYYYYVRVVGINKISLYFYEFDASVDTHRIALTGLELGSLSLTAKVVPIVSSSPAKQIKPKIKFDRTSFTTNITDWVSGAFYSGAIDQTNALASTQEETASSSGFSSLSNNLLFLIGKFIQDDGLVWSVDLTRTTLSPKQIDGARVIGVPEEVSVTKTFASPTPGGTPMVVNIVYPFFSNGNVYNKFGAIVTDGGSGFPVGHQVQVDGSEFGGVSGVNDVTITVMKTYEDFDQNTETAIEDVVYSLNVTGAPLRESLRVFYVKHLNNYIGEWNANTTYYYGQIVSFEGQQYALSHLGDWELDTAYTLGDIVRYDGKYYTPSQPVPNNTLPTETDYWGEITEGVMGVLPGSSNIWMTAVQKNQNSFALYENPTLTTKVVTGDYETNQAYLFIPEIFNFDASRVMFNGSLYECIESNSDVEFDYDKWREVKSDDVSLNALDRITAFYGPTVNMPGKDLTQLINGLTYPYNIYYGNPFAPEEQYPLDTILKDKPFYGIEQVVRDVVWDGNRYVAILNSETTASTCISEDGINWSIQSISTQKFDVSSIFYSGETQNLIIPITRSSATSDFITCASTLYLELDKPIVFSGNVPFGGIIVGQTYYVKSIENETQFTISETLAGPTKDLTDGIGYLTFELVGQRKREYYVTVKNSSTPMLVSYDAVSWISQGPLSSFDEGEYGDQGYDSSALAIETTQLNSVDYFDGVYISVGYEIFKSINGVDWNPVFTFSNAVDLLNEFNAVKYIDVSFFEGFVAVGKGQTSVVTDGVYSIQNTDLIAVSNDQGNTWTRISPVTNLSLNAIANNSSVIVAVGEEGTIIYSTNGYNWLATSSGTTETLRDVIYQNGNFIAIGNNGKIISSVDGMTWANVTGIDTTNDLYAITWSGTEYLIGSSNGVVFVSADGLNWTERRILSTADESLYNVTGDTFTAGYSPEEMMSGVITDTISMYVRTKPSAGWDPETYEYLGFEMTSFVTKPNASNQISFRGVIQTPTSINIFKILDTTNRGPRLYLDIDYTINWVTKEITLTSPLDSSYSIMVELYELGNGPQLVRSTTDDTPLREDSGDSIIYIDQLFSETSQGATYVFVNGQRLTTSSFGLEKSSDNRTILRFNSLYDPETTYISYVIYSDANGVYSIPEAEVFTFTSTRNFVLTNFLDSNAISTLIVSVNGVRLSNTKYSLAGNTLVIDNSVPLVVGDKIGVITFSNLTGQYMTLDAATATFAEIATLESINSVSVVTTKTPHDLTTGDVVLLNGVSGATEINLTPLQVEVVDSQTVRLYQVYIDNTVNIPLLASGTSSDGVIWGVKSGETIKGILLNNTKLGAMIDPNRLWVTVDGNRINSDKVFFYDYRGTNYVGLLTGVASTEQILINAMTPFVVPNQQEYRLFIDRLNNTTAYNINVFNKTWLVEPLFITDNQVILNDVTRVTTSETYTTLAREDDDGDYDYLYYEKLGYRLYELNLPGITTEIKNMTLRNLTKGITLVQSTTTQRNDFYWTRENLAIEVHMLVPLEDENTVFAKVQAGDVIQVDIDFGNFILVNGEEIRFSIINPTQNVSEIRIGRKYTIQTLGNADFTSLGASSNTVGVTFTATANGDTLGQATGTVIALNTLSGLTRGVNGTGAQEFIPSFTTVFSLLEADEIADLSSLTKYPPQ
jgi:hypothetical protein